MTWSPDSDSSAGGWSPEPEGEAGDARPEVLLVTGTPFRLRLTPIAHERAKAGEQAFATYLADAPDDAPPVAVGMLPVAVVTALLASELFAEPAPLVLRASEGENGQLQGVIAALLRQRDLERFGRRLASADEPWAASVPGDANPIAGVDDGGDDADTERAPFALGAVLRFAENRKHPGDLPAEAADLFMTVLRGGAMDADAKKIDNLISGL